MSLVPKKRHHPPDGLCHPGLTEPCVLVVPAELVEPAAPASPPSPPVPVATSAPATPAAPAARAGRCARRARRASFATCSGRVRLPALAATPACPPPCPLRHLFRPRPLHPSHHPFAVALASSIVLASSPISIRCPACERLSRKCYPVTVTRVTKCGWVTKGRT